MFIRVGGGVISAGFSAHGMWDFLDDRLHLMVYSG
jgi:hypothetical protein